VIDALLVRAVNSFETVGVFAVLLSSRGCCNQEDQCVFQREYGCMASSCQMSRVSRTSCVDTTRGPFAQPQLQLGVKADSEREQHQPRKVLCSVGVACLSSERVQEATEGMVVVR